MPLPLLISAAVAASSEISLLTLVTSTTLALTGGWALGAQLSTPTSEDDGAEAHSPRSFVAELKAFPQQTKSIFLDVFSDFNQSTKLIAQSADKLATLGVQLTDAVGATQKNTHRVQQQVQEPLVRVGQSLSATQKKTDEVVNQLKKAQEALVQANKKISELTVTLKEQEGTLARLNAEVVPLTKALAVQAKEKEQAQKKLERLTAAVHQQQEEVNKALSAQVELNKRLSERLYSLGKELVRVGVHYQKSLIQKQTIEALLADYKTQQTVLVQRINELEGECQRVTQANEVGSSELRRTQEEQLKALVLERQQLHGSLKQQGEINKKLEETIRLLEEQATSLEASLVQLKGDYEESNNKYQDVCSLTASLNAEAQEQEALIAAQEAMIATLTDGRASVTTGSLSFFSRATPVSTAVVPTVQSTPSSNLVI